MKISVSSDKELVADIRAKLKENGGYCPCRLTQTPETKCICKEFLEQDYDGPCHCGLYVKTVEADK